jgi:hypothetical protein
LAISDNQKRHGRVDAEHRYAMTAAIHASLSDCASRMEARRSPRHRLRGIVRRGRCDVSWIPASAGMTEFADGIVQTNIIAVVKPKDR